MVTTAGDIIPAAELSQQNLHRRHGGLWAPGNMKLGAQRLTHHGAPWTGANVEIRDQVGAENIFIFGLTTDQVKQRCQQGLPSSLPLRVRAAAAAGGRNDRQRFLLA